MDLRHLEYFVAVAEELSFTGAAARLHVVQSAVSAAIRVLERELAVELFNRGGGRVSLTGAGTILLPEARRALAAAQTVQDLVDDMRGGLRGVLRVGTDGFVPVPVLDFAALFMRFHASHPRMTVVLDWLPAGSPDLLARIANGQLDLGLVTWRVASSERVRPRLVAEVPLVVVCHPGHRLATGHTVSLRELAHEPFVDFPRGSGVRARLDQAFAAAGVERRTLFEVPEVATAVELVRSGLGMACVPSEPADALRGLPVVRVSDVQLALGVWLVVGSSARSTATQSLIRAAELQLDGDR